MNSSQKSGGKTAKKGLKKPKSSISSVRAIESKSQAILSTLVKAMKAGAGSYIRNQSIPAAVWNTATTFMSNVQNIRDANGLKGVRISGSQVFRQIAPTASTAPFGDLYAVKINPHTMGAPLLTLSSAYRRFFFRKMSFRYVTAVSTSASNTLAFAWESDPTADVTSFDSVTEVANRAHAAITPVWGGGNNQLPTVTVDLSKSNLEPYYVSNGGYAGDDAEIRQDFQGTLCAVLGAVGTGTYGYIMLDYTIDLLELTVGITSPSFFLPQEFDIPAPLQPKARILRREIFNLTRELRLMDMTRSPSTASALLADLPPNTRPDSPFEEVKVIPRTKAGRP